MPLTWAVSSRVGTQPVRMAENTAGGMASHSMGRAWTSTGLPSWNRIHPESDAGPPPSPRNQAALSGAGRKSTTSVIAGGTGKGLRKPLSRTRALVGGWELRWRQVDQRRPDLRLQIPVDGEDGQGHPSALDQAGGRVGERSSLLQDVDLDVDRSGRRTDPGSGPRR